MLEMHAERRHCCSLSPVPEQFRISVEFLRALYVVQHIRPSDLQGGAVHGVEMEPTVRFQVLIDPMVKTLTLKCGIPLTVDELVAAIQKQFAITTEISVHYNDEEFNDHSSVYTLMTTKDRKDKDTLKVVCSVKHNTDPCSPGKHPRCLRCVLFIPTFSQNADLALRQGNDIYLRDGTLLTSPSVKSDILERLAEAMFCYTAYPNDARRSAVAQALIEKHPCLKEPGSFSGIYGWQQSLKYKCGNYRTRRKALGNPELLINLMKHKMGDDRKPDKNIKKPKRAEVNYMPQRPSGETDSSLENVRLDLIEASKKRDVKSINDMMARTCSWRTMEVVAQSPDVPKLKERWPALFEPFQYPSTFVVKKGDVTLRCLIEYMGENGQELISDYYGKTESSAHENAQYADICLP